MSVTVISFGYLHGDAPAAHITLDLRRHFRDPHVSPELRHLTANDGAVREAVLSTFGIKEVIEAAAEMVWAYRRGPVNEPIIVAVGCAGGRHRAAVVANELGRWIRSANVVHLHLDKPVVER